MKYKIYNEDVTAKLLLPPNEYTPRKILVPFSGAGSEMIGCMLAGWEQIVGVEFDKKMVM